MDACQDVFTLTNNGHIHVIWTPRPMTEEDVKDIKQWLELVSKKIIKSCTGELVISKKQP